MAGAHYSVEVDNRDVIEMLQRLVAAGEDLSAPFKDLGEYFLLRTDERFSAEAGPGGVAWAPLAPSTLAKKKRAKILTESGRLRASMTYSVDPNTLDFGTNVIYAAIQQLGGAAGRGLAAKIPPRPYLGVDEQDGREIVDTLRDYVQRAAEGR